MAAPVVAVVTGFPRNRDLIDLSFPALRALKQRGVIQRILYVTWDTPAIDDLVAPAERMRDVEVVRVPQPVLAGAPAFTSVMYQVHNLEAALALIPDDDTLIFKTRPDLIIDQDFIESKICDFDTLCAPSDFPKRFKIPMPPAAFTSKIWLPWADSNFPLAIEDAAFMGRKRDIAKLADRRVEHLLKEDYYSDPRYGMIVHIARYYCIFESAYPIFRNYLRNFRLFPNTIEYRYTMLSGILTDAFFHHLMIANAWLIATNFHIDCGEPGQLVAYSNAVNRDWSSVENLKVHPPYNDVAMWREGQKPGGIFPCVQRVYGTLVDDSWQQALFTRSRLRDFTPLMLRDILRNVASYPGDAMLAAEDAFYGKLTDLYNENWLTRTAA